LQLLLGTALVWEDANENVADLKAHLKHISQYALAIARVAENQYISHIATNSNDRGRLLMGQRDHHIAWGLTQLATYVEEEPPTES